MSALIQGLNSKTKHKIDFSLVPVAIILIEFSVFVTQLPQEVDGNLRNLILMRILHTVVMLFIAFLVSQTYMRINWTQQNYQSLAITGILVIALGDLIHSYLASIFGIELVSVYRRLGIIIIQGSLWFPAFIIVGGNRKEIFKQFKEYENRLIIDTRARNRTSNEFKDVQRNTQDRIRKEFYTSCELLRDSIAKIVASKGSLSQQFAAMKPHLVGEPLRKLSRSLDNSSVTSERQSLVDQNQNSVLFFLQQFRILYTSTIRSAPLSKYAYVLVLIALVTPPYLTFYTLREFLISYPILLTVIFFFSYLIVKVQAGESSRSLRNASILIFFTGSLPFAFHLAGRIISDDSRGQLPILITAVALALTYYLSMELLQILRPSALRLIRNDELKASDALKNKVRKRVSDEFSQNLSHRWAVFIHGKILTRLAATSLKLETASKVGEVETFRETVQSLLSLLTKPDADFEEESTDLQTEVISRLDPWRGLLSVTLHIDKELKSFRTARVRDIGEVIEELISNSIRHGKAQKIDLHLIHAEDKEIDIFAVDDASTPPPESITRYGLGTRIFNLASDGRWSISRVGSSTEFALRMSIEK